MNVRKHTHKCTLDIAQRLLNVRVDGGIRTSMYFAHTRRRKVESQAEPSISTQRSHYLYNGMAFTFVRTVSVFAHTHTATYTENGRRREKHVPTTSNNCGGDDDDDHDDGVGVDAHVSVGSGGGG